MEPDKSIALRPRFYKELLQPIEEILSRCEKLKEEVQPNYSIKTSGNHIWLYIGEQNKKFYSPHLHLELEHRENNQTHVRGLFGPNQTLWTLFMFLHFIIAGIFLIFSMIAYSNWSLKLPYKNDLLIMSLMVVVWGLLYLIGRSNRHHSVPQMKELEELMNKILT